MTSIAQVQQSMAELEQLYINRQSKDNKFTQLYKTIKLAVYSFDSIDPNCANINSKEIELIRQFLELSVLYALDNKNLEEFEQYILQLVVFYNDYSDFVKQSVHYAKFIAIYLLNFLSQNQISEFHTALELINISDQNDQHINFILNIERSLAKGNLHSVLNCVAQSPQPQMIILLNKIIDTIRSQIARSSEKAYNYLLIEDALKIFQLKSTDELKNFIVEQKDIGLESKIEWSLEDNKLCFKKQKKQEQELKQQDSIKQMLYYAYNLEQIV